MPEFNIKSGATIEDSVAILKKTLTWLLNNLDSLNIKSLEVDKLIAGTAKISTALIEDLIVGGNVQIGSAQDAAGVTTIIGGTVTTSFINALHVHAGSVDAENITGTTITGKTISGGTINGATINGGTINVSTDINIGNNINIGNQASSGKIINFFNSSGEYSKIELDSYQDLNITTSLRHINLTTLSGNIDSTSFSDINLYAPFGSVGINSNEFGVFGYSAVQQAATRLTGSANPTYGGNEQGMLNNIVIKINGILDKLALYGLFSVS